MRTDPGRLRFAAILLAALDLGCGAALSGGGRPDPSPDGPHGGVAIALPGDAGFGEVVIEPAPGGARKRQVLVVAYFYAADLKTAIANPPARVEVSLAMPGAEPARLALTPQSAAKAKSDVPRFASPPGPYQLDSISGELTVDLGGQSSTIPFASGR